MKNNLITLLFLISIIACNKNEDISIIENPLYFPPLTGDYWETISPSELNWNENDI